MFNSQIYRTCTEENYEQKQVMPHELQQEITSKHFGEQFIPESCIIIQDAHLGVPIFRVRYKQWHRLRKQSIQIC